MNDSKVRRTAKIYGFLIVVYVRKVPVLTVMPHETDMIHHFLRHEMNRMFSVVMIYYVCSYSYRIERFIILLLPRLIN